MTSQDNGAAAQAGWYIADGGDQAAGPFTDQEVLAKCTDGEINSDALCWREGMQDWKFLAETEPFIGAVAHSGVGLSGRTIRIIGLAAAAALVATVIIIAALGGRKPTGPSGSRSIGAGKLVIGKASVSGNQKMAGPFGNEPHYTLTAEVRNVGFKPVELSYETFKTEADVQHEFDWKREAEKLEGPHGDSATPLPWTLSLETRTGRVDGSAPPGGPWGRPMGIYWWQRESADPQAPQLRRVVIKPGGTEIFTMLLPKTVMAGGSTHRVLRAFLIDDQGRRVDEQTVKR